MKEQAKQRDIRERDRELQDRVQEMRQEVLMRSVFLCLIHKDLNQKVGDDITNTDSSEYREMARQILQQINQIVACSLYCRVAVKVQIPVYSNLDIFRKIKQSSDARATIVAQLVNPDMLTEEEQTYSNVINEFLFEETNGV